MKKHHWHAFRHEKLFEKQPQPHCQIHSKIKIPLPLIVITFNNHILILNIVRVHRKILVIKYKIIFYSQV
jgi:hypothetical protein